MPADGGLETRDAAMNRLLALRDRLPQEDLSEQRNEGIERIIASQSEQIRKSLRVTIS